MGGVGEDKIIFELSHKVGGIASGHFGAHAGFCNLEVRNTIEGEVVFTKDKLHQLNEGCIAGFDLRFAV